MKKNKIANKNYFKFNGYKGLKYFFKTSHFALAIIILQEISTCITR